MEASDEGAQPHHQLARDRVAERDWREGLTPAQHPAMVTSPAGKGTTMLVEVPVASQGWG